jgi:hypothetical protein
MKLSSDYLPMISGYLPIFPSGPNRNGGNRPAFSGNRPIPLDSEKHPSPNLPIIHGFAPAENALANQSHHQAATLDWQPIVKVEHHRLKQDSLMHSVE